MLNIERRGQILDKLRQSRSVYVDELAEMFSVSKSTIRRDLKHIEEEGYASCSYGGAVLAESPTAETPAKLRKYEQQQEKDAIARIAAALVKDGMLLFFDVSSSNTFLIRHLGNKHDLTIVTTSAETALDCMEKLDATVYGTGGLMQRYSRGFSGEISRQRITEYYADILFFSARSLSLEHGITDINVEEIVLKREFLANSKQRVFLCDHTKFDTLSVHNCYRFDEIDVLVTDREPSLEWKAKLKKSGVTLMYPDKKKKSDA